MKFEEGSQLENVGEKLGGKLWRAGGSGEVEVEKAEILKSGNKPINLVEQPASPLDLPGYSTRTRQLLDPE